MRVKVVNVRSIGGVDFGELVGLLVDDHDNVNAVVRVDGFGLFCKLLHPSMVSPTTPEEEARYKP